MRHYEVFITDKAKDEMEAINTYIAETLQNPIAAAKQYNRIADAILTLEKMPERIKVMASEPEHSKGLRALFVDNYTVFFIIKADMVYVLRVLYSASDIISRLSVE